MSSDDVREKLGAALAKRGEVEEEMSRLEARLEEARAKVVERQQELAAIAKLDLPPRSVLLHTSLSIPMFNWGGAVLGDAPFMLVPIVLMVVWSTYSGVRKTRAERRLLGALAPRPPRTRVSIEPAADEPTGTA